MSSRLNLSAGALEIGQIVGALYSASQMAIGRRGISPTMR